VTPAVPAVAAALGVVIVAPAALVATVLFTTTSGAVLADGCAGAGGPGEGVAQVGQVTFSAEQMTNAWTITSVVQERHLPQRAAVIAVTAALVESGLRNTPTGDRDSLGLFQERPSQGWGTPEDILNPAYATKAFLAHLTAVPNWAVLPPGAAEQDVELSGFPDRYGPQEPVATALVDRFWPGSVTSVSCPDQGAAQGPANAVGLPQGFTLPADPREAAAVSFAIAQIGKPYVWGAKGPNAFDCSGLVQAAWAAAGVALDAGTTSQVHDGTAVPGRAFVQPGDLVFIPGSLGSPANPRHVGLYAGDGLVINAYDSATGVIVQPLSSWANQVVAIRRPVGALS
jgi:cell wall-associated NlpC family hydrolase